MSWTKVYRHKGEIMLELDQLDSARHYFALNKDVQDVYGMAARYDGLYELERDLVIGKLRCRTMMLYGSL